MLKLFTAKNLMAKFLFLHLPKTAGTSLRLALQEAYGPEAVSPHVNACFLQNENLDLLNQYTFICGHLSFADARRLFPDAATFTVVREPVERCISWYWYARAATINQSAGSEFLDVQAAKNFDMDTFFSLPWGVTFHNIHNRMTRQLGSHACDRYANLEAAYQQAQNTLRQCLWIGRQDQLEEDMQRLSRLFPKLSGLTLPRKNVTENRTNQRTISSITLKNIQAHNRFDQPLYEQACELSAAASG